MTNLEMWSLLVGIAAPVVLAIVQQPSWTRPMRAAVTFLLCLLLGAGTAYFNGDLSGKTWVSCTLLILVATYSSYVALWKPTKIAPAIESSTSPGMNMPPTTPAEQTTP